MQHFLKDLAIKVSGMALHAADTHRATSEWAARKGRLKERCGLEPRTNFFSFKKSAKTSADWIREYTVLWVCISSIKYAGCKGRSPYCHLCPTRPYNIIPHYLIKARFSDKKISWTRNVCFDFLCDSCLQVLFRKKCAGYDQKCLVVFM